MPADAQRRPFGRTGLPVEPAEQRRRAVDVACGHLRDDHGDGANTAAAGASQPALRSDGGPEETGVAAALGPPRAASAPDECRIAAAIAKGARLRPRTGPDERATAAAIVAGR